jgi:preprotein translocase subunit Sss1
MVLNETIKEISAYYLAGVPVSEALEKSDKDEIARIVKRVVKNDLEEYIQSQVKKCLKSDESEEVIKKLSADVLGGFLALVGNRKNIWRDSAIR